MKRGRIFMTCERYAEAETVLHEAAAIGNDNGLHYNEARAKLSLAMLYWNLGKTEDALAQLSRAVDLSIRFDYSYLLASKATSVPTLFQAAIKTTPAADYLKTILPSLAQQTERSDASSLDTEAAASQKVIEPPAYDLAINMLGSVEVFRDPSGMKKEAWRLSKALHIFCYLCSRRNHRAPKETVVDLFWSDADSETVARNFHPTISHLRKALNSEQVMKKDFVLYREGAYLLNPQYRYQLDTEQFESLLGKAREARRLGDPEESAGLLAEAIKL